MLEHLQRTGRGGPRLGAGAKPKGRPGIVWHVRREHFRRLAVGHVTLRVREGVPSMRAPRFVRDLRRSFGEACDRGDFRLVHYSIQRDHLHLIVEADDHEALGRGMKAIGSRVARAVERVFGWSGPVLLGRYHLRRLGSPRQVRNALRYVLLNARRHAVQRVPELRLAWEIDPASSGHAFDGWKPRAVGKLSEARRLAGVASPRSWLLRTGWRRHGLFSPLEMPGWSPITHPQPSQTPRGRLPPSARAMV